MFRTRTSAPYVALSVILTFATGLTSCKDGAVGPKGHDSLAITSEEPKGQNCRQGGQKLTVGTDSNEDGTLQESEVIRVSYVCDGEQSLAIVDVLLVAEGDPRCSGGGYEIQVGYDTEAPWDELTTNEIRSSELICHQQPMLSQMIRVTQLSVGSSSCPAGGALIEVVEDNGNQIIEPSEIKQSLILCNGVNGSNGQNGTNGSNGLDALVNITPLSRPENPGSWTASSEFPCQFGGVQILTGRDLNRDGILQNSEVDPSQTRVLCAEGKCRNPSRYSLDSELACPDVDPFFTSLTNGSSMETMTVSERGDVYVTDLTDPSSPPRSNVIHRIGGSDRRAQTFLSGLWSGPADIDLYHSGDQLWVAALAPGLSAPNAKVSYVGQVSTAGFPARPADPLTSLFQLSSTAPGAANTAFTSFAMGTGGQFYLGEGFRNTTIARPMSPSQYVPATSRAVGPVTAMVADQAKKRVYFATTNAQTRKPELYYFDEPNPSFLTPSEPIFVMELNATFFEGTLNQRAITAMAVDHRGHLWVNCWDRVEEVCDEAALWKIDPVAKTAVAVVDQREPIRSVAFRASTRQVYFLTHDSPQRTQAVIERMQLY